MDGYLVIQRHLIAVNVMLSSPLLAYRPPVTEPVIVESCPPTKLNGGLSRLHSADEEAVSWLTK